jgi:hypothetical protein
MINRLTSAIVAAVLVLGCGAVALASSGGSAKGTNAAISQYEPVVPTPPEYAPAPETHEENGVSGLHESGGKPKKPKNHSGSGPAAEGGGPEGEGTAPVETASTSPVAAATGLPFTGFDVLVVGGVGLLLLMAGLAQRRFEAKRRS